MPLPLASGRGGGTSRAQRVRGATPAVFRRRQDLWRRPWRFGVEALVAAWAAPEAGLVVILSGRRCAWCVLGGLGAMGLDRIMVV